ncbi:MAG: PIN domain-containing protein [Candidatus Kariarchaeaceae archaeon]|jgi:predicted nucleic acid-binding protein
MLDTSLIFAVYDEDDENHETAKKIFKRIFNGEYAQPILLDHVYDELLTLIFIRTKRFELCTKISKIINDFVSKRRITFIHTPSEVFWKANQTFLEQKIQKHKRFLSFTDTIIGSMSNWLDATYIGTFDTQFHRFHAKIISE